MGGWESYKDREEIRDVRKAHRFVKNFLTSRSYMGTKDSSFLSMTRILSVVLGDKGTRQKNNVTLFVSYLHDFKVHCTYLVYSRTTPISLQSSHTRTLG